MQTSSNFFNKNLFTVEDQTFSKKRTDKYHESHILPDPLRLKDELTPWTEINPKYNFNTDRLIKFKQKVHQQQHTEQHNPQILETKEIKSEMISNLFNFYKNSKEKKRSTLNNAKRKSSNNNYNTIDENDNSWTLPPIEDKSTLEEDLVQNKQSIKKGEGAQQTKEKKDKKQPPSGTFIESISIRQYLMKLKEKERVFSSSQAIEKLTAKNPLKSQIQEFTSSRNSKQKNKNLFSNSISSVKQLANEDISYRYAPIRNLDNPSYKKRPYFSPLQSLQQSFQIYKKAAQQEVQESIGSRKLSERYTNKPNANLISEKQYWKNNIPLTSLLSSPILESSKRNEILHQSISPVKKYSTISYSKSFSPAPHSVELPKIIKQNSYSG